MLLLATTQSTKIKEKKKKKDFCKYEIENGSASAKAQWQKFEFGTRLNDYFFFFTFYVRHDYVTLISSFCPLSLLSVSTTYVYVDEEGKCIE